MASQSQGPPSITKGHQDPYPMRGNKAGQTGLEANS